MKKDFLFKKQDRIALLIIFILLLITIFVVIGIILNSYFYERINLDTFILLLIVSLVILFGLVNGLYSILFMQSYVIINEKSISYYCYIKKYNKTISWFDIKVIEKKDLYFAGRAGGYKTFIVMRTNNLAESEFYSKGEKLWCYKYIKRSDTILLEFEVEKFNEIISKKQKICGLRD